MQNLKQTEQNSQNNFDSVIVAYLTQNNVILGKLDFLI